MFCARVMLLCSEMWLSHAEDPLLILQCFQVHKNTLYCQLLRLAWCAFFLGHWSNKSLWPVILSLLHGCDVIWGVRGCRVTGSQYHALCASLFVKRWLQCSSVLADHAGGKQEGLCCVVSCLWGWWTSKPMHGQWQDGSACPSFTPLSVHLLQKGCLRGAAERCRAAYKAQPLCAWGSADMALDPANKQNKCIRNSWGRGWKWASLGICL